MSGELHTAGSYLIILQNLEKPIIARQVSHMSEYNNVQINYIFLQYFNP